MSNSCGETDAVTGLAVFPTLLVIKDHVPIEYDKNASTKPESRDEEEGAVQNNVESGKGNYVIGETVATKS